MTSTSQRSAPGVLSITPWYGGVEGGVGVATETITHSLLRAGARCVVVEPLGDGVVPRIRHGRAGELIVGLCVRPHSSLTGPVRVRAGYHARRATSMAALALLKARFGLTVAHFHYSHESYPTLFEICRRVGLATVLTLHGTDVNNVADDGRDWIGIESLLDSTDLVTTVSAALLHTIVDRSPAIASKAVLVPNPVPVDVPGDDPFGSREPDKSIDVLFLGNLRTVKGPDVLLEAMPAVVAQFPHVTLTIAGDGPLRAQLTERSVQTGIDRNVTFCGRVSRRDAIALVRRSRIVAIPSRSEGAPLVALEAQSLGVPVVACNVGGIPEIVADGRSGLLCPPEDPSALARLIVRLLCDDALRQRLGADGRVRAAAFSPDRIASQYLGVYEQVVTQRRNALDARQLGAKAYERGPA